MEILENYEKPPDQLTNRRVIGKLHFQLRIYREMSVNIDTAERSIS